MSLGGNTCVRSETKQLSWRRNYGTTIQPGQEVLILFVYFTRFTAQGAYPSRETYQGV